MGSQWIPLESHLFSLFTHFPFSGSYQHPAHRRWDFSGRPLCPAPDGETYYRLTRELWWLTWALMTPTRGKKLLWMESSSLFSTCILSNMENAWKCNHAGNVWGWLISPCCALCLSHRCLNSSPNEPQGSDVHWEMMFPQKTRDFPTKKSSPTLV